MEDKNERFQKQMDFMLLVDRMKNIERQTYISDGSRKENDAEHSFHLAMMALFMCEHANERIDRFRTMAMVLTHDLVEIDAGDTYAYDEIANSTKRQREVAAADRIFNILPEDQAKFLRQLWDEFEENITPEARFAHAIDNAQPVMLNDASGGKSWLEHGTKVSQPVKRNEKTKDGSYIFGEYVNGIFEKNVKDGNLIDDRK